MYRVLNISKTGLHATQNKMDYIANDISNIETTGYKKKQVNFQELLHNEFDNRDVLQSPEANISINAGSRSGITSVDFCQGSIIATAGEYDLAINGPGFFGLTDGEGNLVLTRNGHFHVDENLNICADNGYHLNVQEYIPRDEWGYGKVSISSNGEIYKSVNGEDILVGRVILYMPEQLSGLIPLGETMYQVDGVGLINSIQNEEIFGSIAQYALEKSNVDLAQSMADMIITQRAYSLNGRAVQTTDDIMGMINNIKR